MQTRSAKKLKRSFYIITDLDQTHVNLVLDSYVTFNVTEKISIEQFHTQNEA